VVPAGVTSILVAAVGAPGAVGGFGGGAAGRSARVTGRLAVTPGQTLYVNVGGDPTHDQQCEPRVACVGGFNGGGSSTDVGGGGGGGSDVRTVSYQRAGSLGSRLIVAGGGGGSGGGTEDFCKPPPGLGGAGGDAGSNGSPGVNCGSIADSPGGAAGTASAGGAGGFLGGQRGVLGQGGLAAGSGLGGGGGGGLFGGGGGGMQPAHTPTTGGGGGGGSNLVPGGGTAIVVGGGPSVRIAYRAIGLTPPAAPKLHLAIAGTRGVKPGHTAAYRITLRRTQPHTGRRYTVTSVHVVSTHAGHRVGHWLVRTLPRGRSRTLRLKLEVPSTAHRRFCITTRAAARHTRGAAVRYCTAVVTAPPRGLG